VACQTNPGLRLRPGRSPADRLRWRVAERNRGSLELVAHLGGESHLGWRPLYGRGSGKFQVIRQEYVTMKATIVANLAVTGLIPDQWTASCRASIKYPTHRGVRFISIRTRINSRCERHVPGPNLRQTPGPRVCPVLRDRENRRAIARWCGLRITLPRPFQRSHACHGCRACRPSFPGRS
jgi:hypothetical protein